MMISLSNISKSMQVVEVIYLSSTLYEELVLRMSQKVMDEIVLRISLDSTTDESHVDQLTLIFRFIEETTPVERSVTFMPNQGHEAQEMFDGLTKFLPTNDIDLKNCRRQYHTITYNNASAMRGKYNGLQAKVAAKNKLAEWIPCTGHSLNLVVKAAAECCAASVSFFDFLVKIYAFFTGSTYRYQILTETTKLSDRTIGLFVPKRVTKTRWSCRADVCKALERGYSSFKSSQFIFCRGK